MGYVTKCRNANLDIFKTICNYEYIVMRNIFATTQACVDEKLEVHTHIYIYIYIYIYGLCHQMS